MRSLRDLYLSALRQQHPDRNFQSPPRWIGDSDSSISPLRSAEDLKSSAVKWVERIEDLDVRAFRAQGIVGVGASTRTFTAWCRAEEYHPTAHAGSRAENLLSSFPIASSATASGKRSCDTSQELFAKADFTSPANSNP